MKKIFFLLVVVVASNFAFAQDGKGDFWDFSIGNLSTKNAGGGFSWGLNKGWSIDERMNLFISTDLFVKKIENSNFLEKYENISSGEKKVIVSKNRLIYFPILINFEIKIPMKIEKLNTSVLGGIGFGFMNVDGFNVEVDDKDLDESKNYFGFGWKIGSQLEYKIGSKSSIFSEISYLSNKLSRKDEKIEDEYIIVDEVNMSNIGLKIGITLCM